MFINGQYLHCTVVFVCQTRELQSLVVAMDTDLTPGIEKQTCKKVAHFCPQILKALNNIQ